MADSLMRLSMGVPAFVLYKKVRFGDIMMFLYLRVSESAFLWYVEKVSDMGQRCYEQI